MGGEASGAVLFRPVMAGLSVSWMAVGPEFGCGCLGLFRKDWCFRYQVLAAGA